MIIIMIITPKYLLGGPVVLLGEWQQNVIG